MARDVSGTYSLPNPALQAGQIVSASENQATRADMAAALTDSLSRTGNGGMQANLAMGANRITNLAASVAANDAARRDEITTTNVLINPNFNVNQRGYISGTATTAANQYTVDRWRVVTLGESLAWTEALGVRTATAPAGGIEQVVEGASLRSGTYTLTWTGTATATVNGTATVNNGAVTLTGGSNATVRFSGGTVSSPALVRGNVAGNVEVRHPGTELSLCQRYFALFYFNITSPVAGTVSLSGHFPVTMRATPTLNHDLVTQANVVSYTASALSPSVFQIDTTFSGGGHSARTLVASAEL
jgi:hypothetical protein